MEGWESDMVAEMKREREALREENARLRELILAAESDIKALGFEAHPAVTMRMDCLVRASRKGQKP